MARRENEERRTLPEGLEDHGGKIRIRYGRNFKETTDLSAANPKDIATAKKYREKIKANIIAGLPPHGPDVYQAVEYLPFEKAVPEYLSTCPVKESTRTLYRQSLMNFWMPHFKGKPLCSITQRDLILALATKTTKRASKNNSLSPLNGLFKHYGITPNPALNLNHTKKSQKQEVPKVDRYNNTDRTALILGASGEIQMLLVLLFGGGFRPGEALGFQKGDFDLKSQLCHVERQATYKGIDYELKTYHDRVVYLPDWCMPYLRKHLQQFDNAEDFIFLNSQGAPYRNRKTLYARFEQLHKKAGVALQRPGFDKREFYVCRHTRASELLSSGISRGEAAEQLGHTPQTFDQIYARFIREFTGKDSYKHLNGQPLLSGGLRLVDGE